MTSLKDLKRKLLANPEVKAAYDALTEEEQIAAALVQARLATGLTQEDLAARMGTRQEVIARLESGRHLPSMAMPSMATLKRYARATGRRLLPRAWRQGPPLLRPCGHTPII